MVSYSPHNNKVGWERRVVGGKIITVGGGVVVGSGIVGKSMPNHPESKKVGGQEGKEGSCTCTCLRMWWEDSFLVTTLLPVVGEIGEVSAFVVVVSVGLLALVGIVFVGVHSVVVAVGVGVADVVVAAVAVVVVAVVVVGISLVVLGVLFVGLLVRFVRQLSSVVVDEESRGMQRDGSKDCVCGGVTLRVRGVGEGR
jgi:hypothetical protein